MQMGEKGLVESRTVFFGLLFVAFLAASLLLAEPAHARTFTVNTTGDTGDDSPDGACGNCTLRQAIQEANANQGADTINFNIPDSFGAGVKSISPNSVLPDITDPVTIDGYTQPGASPNTLSRGTNAKLMIELNGLSAGDGVNGLKIHTSNSVVRGLVINRFGNDAVQLLGEGNRLEGNFIGTDPSGTQDLGNGNDGIFDADGGNTIGGATLASRNLISGNGTFGRTFADGISVFGSGGTRVQGNLIGTDASGTRNLGNVGAGLDLPTNNNLVGGSKPSAANTIAFNCGDGVQISLGTGNRILRNSLFSNGGLGIDLRGEGESDDTNVQTPNDPKDPDTSSNNLQNFPVITSATTSGGQTTVKGRLNRTPDTTFTLQFFSNPGEEDEGKTFIGQKKVTTDDSGNAPFNFSPAQQVGAGNTVTATATDPDGNTSEFSAPRKVLRP